MNIKKQSLHDSHTLVCPSCSKPIYVAHPDSSEVPGGGTWLRDGDSVGGLWQMLSDVQKTPSAFACELMVGGCRACGTDYYVATASFMDGSLEKAEDYLYFNTKLGSELNYLCRGLIPESHSPVESPATETVMPIEWLLHEYSTPIGLMHHHIFGPWALKDADGVVGEYGVSSGGCGCKNGSVAEPWVHARNLLLTMWDDLRALRHSS